MNVTVRQNIKLTNTTEAHASTKVTFESLKHFIGFVDSSSYDYAIKECFVLLSVRDYVLLQSCMVD